MSLCRQLVIYRRVFFENFHLIIIEKWRLFCEIVTDYTE